LRTCSILLDLRVSRHVCVACVAAAKAPGEPRRVNAPSLALFDLGINEPVGSANQKSTARVSPNQISPVMGVPPNRPLAVTSTNQHAGGRPLKSAARIQYCQQCCKTEYWTYTHVTVYYAGWHCQRLTLVHMFVV
jgi:hypothetical protein